jgi:protein-S-isoprenylcysteine O-methyltransferase Ste14
MRVLGGGACSLIFPVFLFLLAQFLMILMEENKMEQAYGAQYGGYSSRAGRWL